MEYTKENGRIKIVKSDDFIIKDILECGQIFRYKKVDNGYEVISANKFAKIFDEENFSIIQTNDVYYFENFFDLKTDYAFIKKNLEKYDILKTAIGYGKGIRILKQEPLEMFISFIISANNNIKRIQKSCNSIAENFGTKIDNFYAFPTLYELSKITEKDFINMGLGYRAKYLVQTIKDLQNFDFKKINNLSTVDAIKELQKFQGVGPKVADCILLFAYSKMDTFPVDTWIEKVYNKFFSNGKTLTNRAVIRKNLTSIFGNLSGYAQQYLFYSILNLQVW